MAFSSLFSPARRSMEPLLSSGTVDKEKQELYPRSASPVSSNGDSQTGHPSRRKKLLLIAMCLGGLTWMALEGGRKTHQHLAARRHAFDIRIKTVEQPYTAPRDYQRQYTWSKDAFLPITESSFEYINGSLYELAGHRRETSLTKEHTIPVFPKEISLEGLPDNVRPEEIVFGFTSPYRRARDMCSTWRHFLRHGSQCLIVLPKEEEPFKQEMQFYLQKEGLGHCRVTVVDLGKYTRYEHRVMNLPRAMVNEQWTDSEGKSVTPKWYIVADDDSQMLDMRALRREMGARQHKDVHMLCAVTESQVQLGRHGKICYGGGGVVMSQGLATKMSQKMDECLWWHNFRFGGDEMLTHCASTATAIDGVSIPPEKVFTDIVGLHQVDIPGDGSGVFQSGIPFISIHHYTGWLEIFPLWFCPDRIEALRRIQKAVDFLGGDNLFKRFVYGNGSTLVTLGYSVTLYSEPLKQYELRLMERTYRNWEHELRWPARPAIPEGKAKGRYKTTYFLKDVLPEEKVMVYENARGDLIRMEIDL